jgi:hypothetical protein
MICADLVDVTIVFVVGGVFGFLLGFCLGLFQRECP